MAKEVEKKEAEAADSEGSGEKTFSQPENHSKVDPSQSEISDIMQDIKTAVLNEAEDRKVLEVSSAKRSVFLLTKDMQVSPTGNGKENLPVTLQELENLIRKIVIEEMERLQNKL